MVINRLINNLKKNFTVYSEFSKLTPEENLELQQISKEDILSSEKNAYMQLVAYLIINLISNFWRDYPIIAKLYFACFFLLNSVSTVTSLSHKTGKIISQNKYVLSLILKYLTGTLWTSLLIVFYLEYHLSEQTLICLISFVIMVSISANELESVFKHNIIITIIYVPVPLMTIGILDEHLTHQLTLITGGIFYLTLMFFKARKNYIRYWSNQIKAIIIRNQSKELSLSERLASIGRLAEGVSHEINNPLTIINGNIELLILELQKNKSNTDYVINLIEKVQKSITRIAYITSLLNDLSQQNKKQDYIILNIHDLIEDLFENLEINSSLSFHADKYHIIGDKQKMENILNTLISNSIDALREIELSHSTICISTYNEDKKLIIEFTDNGVGIEDSDLSNLFDPFFSTKELKMARGLSLTTAYSYVQSMDGSISVTSKKGNGTKFILKFPININ